MLFDSFFTRRFHIATIAIALISNTAAAQPYTEQVVGTLEAKGRGWNQIQFVDVESFSVDETPRYGTLSKTIFRGPELGFLVHTIFPPAWNMRMSQGGPHYHLFHEWGFTLEGDSVLYEAISPYQMNGKMEWKPKGGWLDRPPFSIHSANWLTGGLRPQTPYHLLIFEEGDGSLITIPRDGSMGDHYGPERRFKPDPYEPDWRKVKQWNPPWLVDTAHDLEWEPDREVEGRFVKWLSDDWQGGFRSRMIKIPPGWVPPEDGGKTYYKKANVMRYMLFGEMKVWQFQDDDDVGAPVAVKEDFFIYQPPRSIWGYGEGPVTGVYGATWLEVIYAKGLSHGGGPIEQPTVID